MPPVRATDTEEPGAQPVAPSLLHAPETWLPSVPDGQAECTDNTVSNEPQVANV